MQPPVALGFSVIVWNGVSVLQTPWGVVTLHSSHTFSIFAWDQHGWDGTHYIRDNHLDSALQGYNCTWSDTHTHTLFLRADPHIEVCLVKVCCCMQPVTRSIQTVSENEALRAVWLLVWWGEGVLNSVLIWSSMIASRDRAMRTSQCNIRMWGLVVSRVLCNWLAPLPSLSFSLSILYIYIWRRPRFLPTFLAFWKAKTAYFSHFEAKKGKGKKQKGGPKLVVLFLVENCTFSPVLSRFLTKT